MTLFKPLLPQIAADLGIPSSFPVHVFVSGGKRPIPINEHATIGEIAQPDSKFELSNETTLSRAPPAQPPADRGVIMPPKTSLTPERPGPVRKRRAPNQPPPGKEFLRKRSSGIKNGALKNSGNGCFLNAVVQALLSLSNFPEPIVELDGLLINAFLELADLVAKSKIVNPDEFREIVSEVIPKLSGTGQHDAHEFLSLLINQFHTEQPSVIEDLFYGDFERRTVCTNCNDERSQIVKFTSLTVPIMNPWPITFSPWVLTAPLSQKATLEDITVPILLLGLTDDRLEPFVSTTVYTQLFAFEAPPPPTEESDEPGLAVVWLKCGEAKIGEPILVRLPLGSDVDITPLVITRIEDLFESRAWRDVKKRLKVAKIPEEFTLYPGTRICQQDIVVEIPSGSRSFQRTRIEPPPVTVAELLGNFFKPNDRKSQLECVHCGKNTVVVHEIRLLRLPPHLVIHLQRFIGAEEKNDAPVALSDLVDFSPFGITERPLFEVRAVVNHSGLPNSGHYTAVCRRGLAWYLYNDNHTSDRGPPTERASETVYLAFLSRQ